MAKKKKVKAVKAAKKKAPAKKNRPRRKSWRRRPSPRRRRGGKEGRCGETQQRRGEGERQRSSAALQRPWGKAGKALDGVRILDFTHVQSGPTCTQLLAYMGADCIKVERPGQGDITRGQLRDVKGADSLYFTMLNGNKRSITIDSKHPEGQGDPRAAGQSLRRAGGEFRTGRDRAHGPLLGERPQAQPAHHHGVGQGLRAGTV